MARPRNQKSFAEMLRISIKEAGTKEGTTKLRDIADQLVIKAVEGDIQAIREVADRLDGKPAQAVQVSGDPENPIKTKVEVNFVNAPGSRSKD